MFTANEIVAASGMTTGEAIFYVMETPLNWADHNWGTPEQLSPLWDHVWNGYEARMTLEELEQSIENEQDIDWEQHPVPR